MILRPYYNPRPLIEAASTAAFELRKFVRDLTIRDLERFSGLGSCASVGVLTQVQMSEDGAFVAASFDLSPKPEEVEVDAFHCAVPALEGYFRAEMALTEAAENFWFTREVDRRLNSFGRELVHLTDEALDEIETYRHRLGVHANAKDLNEAIIIEAAKKERSARVGESSHARMQATANLAGTKEFLAKELHQARTWFEALAPSDREHLPNYAYRNLDHEARMVFTHRDFWAKTLRQPKHKEIELKFSKLRTRRCAGQHSASK